MSLAKWTILNPPTSLPRQICSKNAIVNWYTGGLNHQIEHIFPNISHVHYGKIAKNCEKKQQKNVIYPITNTRQCVVP
jgi:fatty acid desaturase